MAKAASPLTTKEAAMHVDKNKWENAVVVAGVVMVALAFAAAIAGIVMYGGLSYLPPSTVPIAPAWPAF
jgi:hypothetical protein